MVGAKTICSWGRMFHAARVETDKLVMLLSGRDLLKKSSMVSSQKLDTGAAGTPRIGDDGSTEARVIRSDSGWKPDDGYFDCLVVLLVKPVPRYNKSSAIKAVIAGVVM